MRSFCQGITNIFLDFQPLTSKLFCKDISFMPWFFEEKWNFHVFWNSVLLWFAKTFSVLIIWTRVLSLWNLIGWSYCRSRFWTNQIACYIKGRFSSSRKNWKSGEVSSRCKRNRIFLALIGEKPYQLTAFRRITANLTSILRTTDRNQNSVVSKNPPLQESRQNLINL